MFFSKPKLPAYCSVDLMPEFKIEPIEAVDLARIVNGAMLSPGTHPPGWFRYLANYVQNYKVGSNE